MEKTRIIQFHEGVDASGSVIWRTRYNKNESVNLKNYAGKNDEICSLQLFYVPKGTIIKLYDSPQASTNDDYTVITVLNEVDEFLIGTLEQSGILKKSIRKGDEWVEVGVVKMTYYNDNGLNGKVSHINVNWK